MIRFLCEKLGQPIQGWEMRRIGLKRTGVTIGKSANTPEPCIPIWN